MRGGPRRGGGGGRGGVGGRGGHGGGHGGGGGGGGGGGNSSSTGAAAGAADAGADRSESEDDYCTPAADDVQACADAPVRWIPCTAERPTEMQKGETEADGRCQVGGQDVWCYPTGTVTFAVGETSFSMDACMRWLRHFKTQSNSWMWVDMCKCCGKIFTGTGLSRFIAHFQRRTRGASGKGKAGKGTATCPKLPRASDSEAPKSRLNRSMRLNRPYVNSARAAGQADAVDA